jgi:hypothetical protein
MSDSDSETRIVVDMSEVDSMIDDALARHGGVPTANQADDDEPTVNDLLVTALAEDSPLDPDEAALSDLDLPLLSQLAAEFGLIGGATANVADQLRTRYDPAEADRIDEFGDGLLRPPGSGDAPSANEADADETPDGESGTGGGHGADAFPSGL